MNVAVFGGAFDPITYAHLYIINSVADNPKIDRVFIEVANNVYKSIQVEWKHRAKMVDLAVSSLYKDNIILGFYDGHNFTDKQPFTYETLEFYNSATTIDNIYGVIGSDQLKNWDNWLKNDLLAEKYNWIVFGRGNDNFDEIISSNDVLNKNKNNFTFQSYGTEMSSTEVRQTLSDYYHSITAHRKIFIEWFLQQKIPVEVFEYIEKNNLYDKG